MLVFKAIYLKFSKFLICKSSPEETSWSVSLMAPSENAVSCSFHFGKDWSFFFILKCLLLNFVLKLFPAYLRYPELSPILFTQSYGSWLLLLKCVRFYFICDCLLWELLPLHLCQANWITDELKFYSINLRSYNFQLISCASIVFNRIFSDFKMDIECSV